MVLKYQRQFVFLLVLSVTLMIVDGGMQRFSLLHQSLNSITTPFYRLTAQPVHWLQSIGDAFQSRYQLQQQNQVLQQQLAQQQVQLQRVHQLQADKQQLSAALKLQQSHRQLIAASILRRVGYPYPRQFYLQAMQPLAMQSVAITARGIVGMVTAQMGSAYQLLPIVSRNSYVAVKNANGHLQGIAQGNGHGQLVVKHLAKNTALQLGEQLVTSGLDNIYPAGYVVGKIVSRQLDDRGLFYQVTVQPSVDMNALGTVLVSQRGNHG